MARGNGGMRIFEDKRDYRSFLVLFGEAMQKFEIQCWNYCLMPNHYHATLQPTLPNISAAIQHVNGVYAQRWNKRHNQLGHVFQGRFKDQIVQREGYLESLCRYISRNPARAGLVTAPEDWEWSSYAAIIGLRPAPSFLNVALTLGQFAPGPKDVRQTRFRSFVCGDPDEVLEERFRSNEEMVGDRTSSPSATRAVRRPGVRRRSDPGLTPV
jgi:REP element-mobilizing transposase RayT